jgi:hypothetical protein
MNHPFRSLLLALTLATLVMIGVGCSQPWALDGSQTPSELTASHSGEELANPSATVRSIFDPACLVGAWQVNDLEQAMTDSYAQSQSTLQLQQVEGQAFYEFAPDGTMKIIFDQLAATLAGDLDNRPVTARQSMDGSATARYRVDMLEKKLVFYEFGGDGIRLSLSINQQTLVEGDLPIWSAFTSAVSGDEDGQQQQPVVQSSRVAFECEGDWMKIQAVDPLPGPEVELQRRH